MAIIAARYIHWSMDHTSDGFLTLVYQRFQTTEGTSGNPEMPRQCCTRRNHYCDSFLPRKMDPMQLSGSVLGGVWLNMSITAAKVSRVKP